MPVVFGPFTFDVDRRLLLRGTTSIHVGPKAFDLLQLLIERRPKVVAKTVLMEAVWPKTFVADNSLATLINDLRAALEDGARDPRIIRTAHGVGYAFVADAVELEEERPSRGRTRPLSDWLLVWGQTSLPLYAGANIIGRPASGVIGLTAPTVSRQHARISVSGEHVTLEDLSSKNGTWIGSTRILAPHPVRHGDEIRFGLVLVKLVRVVDNASTKSAQIDPLEETQDISTDS